MPQAHFRFYAELNFFLPLERRQVEFIHPFEGRASVKDMIESFGVPHTEIDLILVGGESVDFSYIVRDGDHVSVYPVFESFDITPEVRVRPKPLREPRFVLDQHLGKLAAYLRMLGFDTLYRNDYDDPELAQISHEEKRTLLTRDRGLLKRSVVTRGYYVRETHPRQQVAEVVRRFDLGGLVAPFRRCITCNGLLEAVDKSAVLDRLPPNTAIYYDEFRRCGSCGQLFWQGPHYERMRLFIEDVLRENGGPSAER